jgi:CBS domain-containing protein
LISFLDEHKGVLGDVVNSPVSLLNLGNSSEFIFSVMLHTKLIQVQPSLPLPLTLGTILFLFQVYRFLVQAGVTGVAVVDKESRLVGNISLSDLYKSVSEHLTQPDVTVEQYIASTPGRHFPIYCHPSTPFGEVLHKLRSAKVYRVFVCDTERHVRGVITLSDIVNFVTEQLLKQ